MWLMESSLLTALETPRLMRRKGKCKGKSVLWERLLWMQGVGVCTWKTRLDLVCGSGEIRTNQLGFLYRDFWKSHEQNAICLVASGAAPQHFSVPLRTVTSTVHSIAIMPSVTLLSLREFPSTFRRFLGDSPFHKTVDCFSNVYGLWEFFWTHSDFYSVGEMRRWFGED